MTARELSQLYDLNREIQDDNRRLEELEAAAMGITSKITGLPHATKLSDKTALAAEIADLRTIIKAKSDMCIAHYNKIMRYIAGIDNSLIRQIMTLRHVDGLTWDQVAAHIGGGNTGDSVRKQHARYLERQE